MKSCDKCNGTKLVRKCPCNCEKWICCNCSKFYQNQYYCLDYFKNCDICKKSVIKTDIRHKSINKFGISASLNVCFSCMKMCSSCNEKSIFLFNCPSCDGKVCQSCYNSDLPCVKCIENKCTECNKIPKDGFFHEKLCLIHFIKSLVSTICNECNRKDLTYDGKCIMCIFNQKIQERQDKSGRVIPSCRQMPLYTIGRERDKDHLWAIVFGNGDIYYSSDYLKDEFYTWMKDLVPGGEPKLELQELTNEEKIQNLLFVGSIKTFFDLNTKYKVGKYYVNDGFDASKVAELIPGEEIEKIEDTIFIEKLWNDGHISTIASDKFFWEMSGSILQKYLNDKCNYDVRYFDTESHAKCFRDHTADKYNKTEIKNVRKLEEWETKSAEKAEGYINYYKNNITDEFEKNNTFFI